VTTASVDNLVAPLTAWIADRLGATQIVMAGLERPAAGQSNDTILCEAVADGLERHLVVRLQTDRPAIFRQPDVLREARVLPGLAQRGVPVPRVLWTEPDPSVLGGPFFVMERISGRVPLGKPSIHTVGWLPRLTAGERARLWASALDVVVAVHDVDWRATPELQLDNDGTGDSLSASVAALTEWYRWSTAGREFPITDAAAEHLAARAPALEGAEAVFLWGDPRVGNMIFRDDHTVAAAIDWETATVGCAERDVAHWLFFDEFQTDAVGIARLAGWPDRETTISRYESQSGRRLRDLAFFDILAELFIATTLIRQADARVARGLAPESTRMGHDNTVTQMLARRLDLPRPGLSPDYLVHRGVIDPAGN
jgi:aminoglycoside phosphotransferase (APT) family kinase protein